MTRRVLGAVVGIAVLLGGLLVATPAQAVDGLEFVYVGEQWDEPEGRAEAHIDFRSRTSVVFRDFTVRDVCPGDGLPVRARAGWTYTDGSPGVSSWKADTNGCGPNGTNFGDISHTGSRVVARAWITVCVYRQSGGNVRCETSYGLDNQYR
ncbi:hypothetical protein ACQPXM_09860 [Kribbella sp. CA-253562]|uniref:hypothetical protein n=1 Tax=Kribbella sp. CA-253562 TaxID=3239942 RepID=UPI003D9338A1